MKGGATFIWKRSGKHLVNDQDVWLEGLSESLLGLLIDVAAGSVFIRDDQARFERGNIIIEPLLDLASLRVGGAYDHSANGRIGIHKAEVQEVSLNEFTEATDIGLVRPHGVLLGVDLGFFKLKIPMDVRSNSGINILLLDAEGISIRDRAIPHRKDAE